MLLSPQDHSTSSNLWGVVAPGSTNPDSPVQPVLLKNVSTVIFFHHFMIMARTLPPLPDHLGIIGNVAVGSLQGPVEIGKGPLIFSDKSFGLFFLRECPFGPFGHHAWFIAANNPKGLFGIDHFFCLVIRHADEFRGFVNVYGQVEGRTMQAATGNDRPVGLFDNHTAVGEFFPVHAAILASRMFLDIVVG
jgi:hypothetical protein